MTRTNLKRILVTAVLLMLLISAAGCGSNAKDVNGGGKTAASDEKITISFWHIWPDGPLSTIIEDYIKVYEAEHPNIKIDAVATQEVEYQNTKLRVAGATGSQGDVFMSWGGGYGRIYVDAGVVLPLDEYYKKLNLNDEVLEGTLEYGSYDGKIYALPLKQWAGTLFCNQELFDQYNLNIPKTWDDLMNAVTVFRAADVTPMVLGAKDGWHIGMIQNALAVRTAGTDYMNKALSGEATFDTPEIVKSAQLLVDLNNAGAFMNGTMGVGSEEAQEEFYMGLVPMYYGGSWVAAGCDDDLNAVKGKIVVTQMPEIPGGKGGRNAYSGGVIDFFMLNANTKHPDEAFDFAYAITKHLSEEAYKIGDSLPAWRLGSVDESEVSPTLIAIKDMIQTSDGYVLAWDTFLTGAAIDTHYQLLQGLIAGTVTPEQFAKEMQEANEAELAK